MVVTYRMGIICLTALFVLTLPSPSFSSTYTVSIDTSAVSGSSGKLVFDFTVNAPLTSRRVDILNFSAPGSTAGLPETEGGLVEGDLILPPFNSGALTRIGGSFFFNELIVNFISFGSSISFTLSIADIGPSPGGVPDQFALFLLDKSFKPLFPTSDPLGTNALFAIDITGAPGGVLSVFSPTTFQAPSTLQIVVPSTNRPPNCTQARPSLARLWPPNHKMEAVSILGVSDPDGDPVKIVIDRIRQDEPTNGTGDGDTCPDGQGIGTSTAQLRAERAGNGDGRVYTIFFTATDGKGGSCQGSVKVCVPHNQNGSCVDGGATFDSTVCP